MVKHGVFGLQFATVTDGIAWLVATWHAYFDCAPIQVRSTMSPMWKKWRWRSKVDRPQLLAQALKNRRCSTAIFVVARLLFFLAIVPTASVHVRRDSSGGEAAGEAAAAAAGRRWGRRLRSLGCPKLNHFVYFRSLLMFSNVFAKDSRPPAIPQAEQVPKPSCLPRSCYFPAVFIHVITKDSGPRTLLQLAPILEQLQKAGQSSQSSLARSAFFDFLLSNLPANFIRHSQGLDKQHSTTAATRLQACLGYSSTLKQLRMIYLSLFLIVAWLLHLQRNQNAWLLCCEQSVGHGYFTWLLAHGYFTCLLGHGYLVTSHGYLSIVTSHVTLRLCKVTFCTCCRHCHIYLKPCHVCLGSYLVCLWPKPRGGGRRRRWGNAVGSSSGFLGFSICKFCFFKQKIFGHDFSLLIMT